MAIIKKGKNRGKRKKTGKREEEIMRMENNEPLEKGPEERRAARAAKKRKRTAGGIFLAAGLMVGAVALFAAGQQELPKGSDLGQKIDAGQKQELGDTGLDDGSFDLSVDKPVPVVDSEDEGKKDAAGGEGGEGGLRPPFPAGTVLKDFSADSLVYSETLQQYEVHEGIDLAAEIGTDVKAAAEGMVVKVYADDRLGTTVVISHSGGYKTVYSNLAVLGTAEEGDEVKAGQVIGKVGATALFESEDPSHLHFEVHKEDVKVDPAQVLGAR